MLTAKLRDPLGIMTISWRRHRRADPERTEETNGQSRDRTGDTRIFSSVAGELISRPPKVHFTLNHYRSIPARRWSDSANRHAGHASTSMGERLAPVRRCRDRERVPSSERDLPRTEIEREHRFRRKSNPRSPSASAPAGSTVAKTGKPNRCCPRVLRRVRRQAARLARNRLSRRSLCEEIGRNRSPRERDARKSIRLVVAPSVQDEPEDPRPVGPVTSAQTRTGPVPG